MSEEPGPSRKNKHGKRIRKVVGGAGITAGGNVNFGDVSGQVAIGSNITQTQTISSSDKKELLESLIEFRKEIAKLGLPEDERAMVAGDVTAAMQEAEKEKPDLEEIKSRFQNAINTIKGVGGAIKTVAESPTTKKILGILKLGLAVLS